MRKWVVVIGALVVLMLPALLQPTGPWLQLRTGDGELVSCLAVRPGDTVTLQFTHSMYGGYVRETWVVTPENQLKRDRIVTENAAAAEYYATEITPVRAADGWEVPGEQIELPKLVVRVNQRGNHQLWIESRSIPLHTLVPGSTQVHLSVEPDTCAQEDPVP